MRGERRIKNKEGGEERKERTRKREVKGEKERDKEYGK